MKRICLAGSAWVGALLVVAGCDPNNPMMNGMTPVEMPGGGFATAAKLRLNETSQTTFQGTINADEVNVFDLGPFAVGDRLVVTVNASGGSALDPGLALFNGAEELLIFNDDVDLSGGNLNSKVDYQFRTATDQCFMCAARSFFASKGGGYSGSVTVTRGAPLAPPMAQALYLDFRGGMINIPNIGQRTLKAFNAADISSTYSGRTAQVKAGVVATVRENFEGTGLVILNSDDGPPPTNVGVSTLFFGGFSSNTFGQSQDVDQENLNCCDDGIIFTEQFSDPFAVEPSVAGIGTAIGNVAAHEAGHLLGLQHTADITDLMDTTGSASTLLADQDFRRAKLDVSVFAIGFQNEPARLQEVIPP